MSKMRRAFTLIEVMVATMLLAMVVTALTMIINQSSIAWTAGLAGINGLGIAREDIAIYDNEAETAIADDLGRNVLRLTSVFDEKGKLRKDTGRTLMTTFERLNVSPSDLRDPLVDRVFSITGSNSAGRDSYIVGVLSYGPDRQTGGDHSWDDISTIPEEIVK